MLKWINDRFDHFTAWVKGLRTVLFNILAAIIPIAQMTEVIHVIPEQYMNWYLLAVALGNMYLRYRTTTPIGKK